jgi:putative component of membrane protein insertase Oxa1/YidC/SpoIIIJ protein YidD
MLFLAFSPCASKAGSLVTALFREGRWEACRIEFARLRHENVEPSLDERFADAVSAARLPDGVDAALASLQALGSQTQRVEIAAAAAYEESLLRWGREEHETAFMCCERAFLDTPDPVLFQRAGCTLAAMLEARPGLSEGRDYLVHQLDALRSGWSRGLRESCRLAAAGRAVSAKMAGGIVRFYRRQISPAIGERCRLHPSCSSYFCEAADTYGWLGFPMIADRLVREPGVSNAKRDPVAVGSEIRYRDPVEAHAFWRQP